MLTTLITRVAAAMADIAPLALADRSWDNVGTLIENPSPSNTGIVLLTIDLTPEVMEECVRKNVEVILSYHPPIFSGMKSLTLRDPKQKIVLQAVRGGMSIYSPHTSLDAAAGGINDWLADIVDATGSCHPIVPASADSSARQPLSEEAASKIGIGRVVDLSAPKTIGALVDDIKAGLEIPTARVSLPANWDRNHLVSSVAICAGSGTSVFRMLKRRVDVLFSGEMGHHDVLAANAAGQAVILCEHTNTERGYLQKRLQGRLQDMLGSEVSVIVSELDKDPLVVW